MTREVSGQHRSRIQLHIPLSGLYVTFRPTVKTDFS